MDKIKEIINWDDFEKVDLRVGTVVKVEEFPEARKPAYKLWVDLGPLGIKKSSAQVTERYTMEKIEGKHVVCIVNFEKKQIGPLRSEILVTGFPDDTGNVVLATVDLKVPNGGKLY